MSCCRSVHYGRRVPGGGTNWMLSDSKQFVCLKQIWSDLWIERLIIGTHIVNDWWLTHREKRFEWTHISTSRAAREERVACAAKLCDGDDGVLTNRDACCGVNDSIPLSIHCQSIRHSTATSDWRWPTTRWPLFHREDYDDGGDCAGDRLSWIDWWVCCRSRCCCCCWSLRRPSLGDTGLTCPSFGLIRFDPSLAVDRTTERSLDMIQC